MMTRPVTQLFITNIPKGRFLERIKDFPFVLLGHLLVQLQLETGISIVLAPR